MDKRRINVRAIIWRNGKLLAVKHKNKNGTPADYWAVPGGGLDPLELVTDGLRRELMEETGVKAIVGKLLFIQQFRDNRGKYNEQLEFLYHVENAEDFTNIDLAKTSCGEKELYCIEFIDPKNEHILPAFLKAIDIEKVIATTQPIFLHSEL